MMSLVAVFWLLVILFAAVGFMRGWVKEALVIFSVILALALNHVLIKYVPVVNHLDPINLFWIQTAVLMALVFFGYQTVALVPRLQSKGGKERVQDAMFGGILGAVNGILIAGTLLYYIAQTDYNVLTHIIIRPDGNIKDAIDHLFAWLPARWLVGEPLIYFAVIFAFIFVIVVFI